MNTHHINRLVLASVVALLMAGCSQQDTDCDNPSTTEQKQRCAHQASTESRIAPTEKPKNWLDLTDPKKETR